MPWSPRILYAAAMLLASMPPLLFARLARPTSAPVIVSGRMGLTLGEDGGHRPVVTSLRSGGPADRAGIAVGDMLRAVAGRPVVGLARARMLIQAREPCVVVLSFDRGGISYRARIWQCRPIEPGTL